MKRLLSLAVLASLLFVSSATVAAGKSGDIWNVPGDFASIQEAIDDPAVSSGDTIRVGPGRFAGATVTKGVHIKGRGQTIIDDGPEFPTVGIDLKQGFRLEEGSDGASFDHLTFEVGFGIYSRGVDAVEVDHCRFEDAFQAVTNWGGSDWRIEHNTLNNIITIAFDGGTGGTGIVIGGYDGQEVAQRNVVAHNKISGQVLFDPADTGQEDPSYISAIAIAVFDGVQAVSNNQVLHNKVSLVSSRPDLRESVGQWLWDGRADQAIPPCDVLLDNTVAYNDFRGTNRQIIFTPEALASCNEVSRNK